MKQFPVLIAMVVLYHNRHFLMQLRDDNEDIIYPGQWGLFGGHLESGEVPLLGAIREVKEEINYTLEKPTLFRCYEDSKASRYIFFAPLETSLSSLELNEGQDLGLVPYSSVSVGRHYSDKVREERTLGNIHRRILLDFTVFAEKNLSNF